MVVLEVAGRVGARLLRADDLGLMTTVVVKVGRIVVEIAFPLSESVRAQCVLDATLLGFGRLF